jgi:hypothetical protein
VNLHDGLDNVKLREHLFLRATESLVGFGTEDPMLADVNCTCIQRTTVST